MSPQSRAKLALDLAECQAGQGEYAKAIDGLKTAEALVKDNAELPAKLADLHVLRGDWEAADRAIARALKAGCRQPSGPVVPGAAARAAGRDREVGGRVEVVCRSLQRETG